jgi:hypothetical protein
MEKHHEPTPPHVRALQTMNHGVMRNDTYENIARSIWEGKAIMGTDGLVKKSKATYSFVMSMSKTNVNINVKGGGFLPLIPQYTDPFIPNALKRRHCLLAYSGSNSSLPRIPTQPTQSPSPS